MKAKLVYTVTREFESDSRESAMNSARAQSDEPGEYLYGASGGEESIQLDLFVRANDSEQWERVTHYL